MIIRFHKGFEKKYKKLRAAEKRKAKERLELFLDEPFNPLLDNHPLKGKYLDYRSIDIAGGFKSYF